MFGPISPVAGARLARSEEVRRLMTLRRPARGCSRPALPRHERSDDVTQPTRELLETWRAILDDPTQSLERRLFAAGVILDVAYGPTGLIH
jgi:hypothetical protein